MSPIACACKDKAKARAASRGQKITVQLPGGSKLPFRSETEAATYVSKHPGAKMIKAAA